MNAELKQMMDQDEENIISDLNKRVANLEFIPSQIKKKVQTAKKSN